MQITHYLDSDILDFKICIANSAVLIRVSNMFTQSFPYIFFHCYQSGTNEVE
jgi:hypothetical protein